MQRFHAVYLHIGKLWWEINYWAPKANRHKPKKIVITYADRRPLYTLNPEDLFIPLEKFLSHERLREAYYKDYEENRKLEQEIIEELEKKYDIAHILTPQRRIKYMSDFRIHRKKPNYDPKLRKLVGLPPYNIIIASKEMGWEPKKWESMRDNLKNLTGATTIICGNYHELKEIGIEDSPIYKVPIEQGMNMLSYIAKYSFYYVSTSQGSASLGLLFLVPILCFMNNKSELKYTEIYNLRRNPVNFLQTNDINIANKFINHSLYHEFGKELVARTKNRLQIEFRIESDKNRLSPYD